MVCDKKRAACNTRDECVCVCTHTLKKPAVVTRSGKVLFTVETFKHRHGVCVCLKLFLTWDFIFSSETLWSDILPERKSPEGGVFQFSQLMFCPFFFCSDQHTLEQFLERGHPFLITKTVGARGQLKLYICEHSKKKVFHDHLPRSPWGESTTPPRPLTPSVAFSCPGPASSALSPHTKAPCLHHFPGHSSVRAGTHCCTSTPVGRRIPAAALQGSPTAQ